MSIRNPSDRSFFLSMIRKYQEKMSRAALRRALGINEMQLRALEKDLQK